MWGKAGRGGSRDPVLTHGPGAHTPQGLAPCCVSLGDRTTPLDLCVASLPSLPPSCCQHSLSPSYEPHDGWRLGSAPLAPWRLGGIYLQPRRACPGLSCLAPRQSQAGTVRLRRANGSKHLCSPGG